MTEALAKRVKGYEFRLNHLRVLERWCTPGTRRDVTLKAREILTGKPHTRHLKGLCSLWPSILTSERD